MISPQQITQRILEKVRVLPMAEPEGHFIDIGGQVLGAHMVMRPDQTALEQAEDILDRIDVLLGSRPFLALIERLVRDNLRYFVIGWQRVGNHHLYVLAQVALNKFAQMLAIHLAQSRQFRAAAALDQPNNAGFTSGPASAFAALGSAHESFVHLNDAVEFGVIAHGVPDAMAQVPGRLVTDSERPLDLVGRNALLGFADEINREEPFPERQMRVMENAACCYGKLVAAFIAVKQSARLHLRGALGLAARAADAFGPAQANQKIAAFVFAIEVFDQLNQVGIHT